MAHKTLIGGTAYEISGGKTLIGGTAYSIDKGKTLVGGTAYDILFSRPMIIVNITGSGNASYCYATINGTKYSAPTTIECEVGTAISCVASGGTSNARRNSMIYVNGSKVSGGSTSGASYTFTPTASTLTIRLGYSSGESTIYITM